MVYKINGKEVTEEEFNNGFEKEIQNYNLLGRNKIM